MGPSTRTRLDVADSAPSGASVLVVGGGTTGRGIAENLAASDAAVTFVDGSATDEPASGATDGVQTLAHRVVDAAGIRAIHDAVGDVDAVVAAGPDSHALLVGHLARRELDPSAVVAIVDDPWHRCAFDGLDLETVVTTEVLARRVQERLLTTISV